MKHVLDVSQLQLLAYADLLQVKEVQHFAKHLELVKLPLGLVDTHWEQHALVKMGELMEAKFAHFCVMERLESKTFYLVKIKDK
jgi:hypothetical protein